MPSIQILVRVIQSFVKELPGPADPGKRYVFSDDLVLERYDDSTPGFFLPQNQQQRLAGTQSGFVSVVREAAAGDRFLPSGTYLLQYGGTYKFNTLANTPLQKGQVTAGGVFLVDNLEDFNRLEQPIRFAITGGTDAYVTARGQITEGVPDPESRLLDINCRHFTPYVRKIFCAEGGSYLRVASALFG